MDFNAKDLNMGIENICNGNIVIHGAFPRPGMDLRLSVTHRGDNSSRPWSRDVSDEVLVTDRQGLGSSATEKAALNLLMNNYGQELLKEMKPEIIRNIIRVMKRFLDNLFAKIPYDMWMLDS
uniref:Uncharacterized protein n=1 Tax=Timema poppense TaxID=170557 RepID=A0A7R9DUS6_TIMPO|nr:unnamed protein product [Timema poppensis]